jgi:exopolysaccharide production protein ExoZ
LAANRGLRGLRGGALGVQLFFVVSGIVIFRAHQNDLGHARKARSFFWKRFRRVYPLYWICLSLTLLKHHATTDHDGAYMHASSVLASSYLLVHLFSYRTIMVQAWTLFDEVQFYLIFSLWIVNRRLGITALGVWLAASLFYTTPFSVYWAVVFSPYHLLFGLGILVALALQAKVPIPSLLLFWPGMIVFALAVITEGPLQWGVPMRLLAGLGAACALLGAILLEREGRLKVPLWLTRLGDASYSIYLVHFMVISAIARFAFAHMGRVPIPIAGWMVLLVLAGVFSGIAVFYAVERPLLRWMGKR